MLHILGEVKIEIIFLPPKMTPSGKISSVRAGQMSAVETGQMTAAETSVLSQQKASILSQQCPRLLLGAAGGRGPKSCQKSIEFLCI